ncbi:AGE family epimerase/isomerase [Microvirga sp. 0TCS3.31]
MSTSVIALALATALATGMTALGPVSAGGSPAATATTTTAPEVPVALRGDSWLQHHGEDLMPYWDMPEALGDTLGNFPSWRGLDGELLADERRGLSTLARGVYGYSVAFLLTGEPRYLTYAKAGIDWINAHARDTVHGGWYGQLTKAGGPVNAEAPKAVFDVASLGLAFGMYYNVTRDPEVEADLLEVRDFVFEHYYDPTTSRIKDALTYDLSEEIDTGGISGNGGNITNYLVPGSALLLPNVELLSDPARRAQFRDDLRVVTEQLIARHRGTGAESWWFWGRTGLVGGFGSGDTDFGHSIKSHELILNANAVFPDRPWSGLSADRGALLQRAWDAPAARWNQKRSGPVGAGTERDSEWWIHDEADQTLAALDLGNGFAHQDWLAASAASWTKVFVDRGSAVRETFFRPARNSGLAEMRKTGFGKNMYHVSEHALIMFLHGRAMEGLPARLHYAFPTSQALTAQAEPYWFDATGERRVVRDEIATLPGHRLVEVEFTGIGPGSAPPFPAPDDTTAPSTEAAVTPEPNAAGWNREDVTVTLSAADAGVGVEEIHVLVEDRSGATPPVAVIEPGDTVVLPPVVGEGVRRVTYWAVDRLGNTEQPRVLEVRIDRTSPTLAGLPSPPCTLWPPDRRMVQVAQVTGADALSGVAGVQVAVTADEPTAPDDVRVDGGTVEVRASRSGRGEGRTYLVRAVVTDLAGNATHGGGECTVPHDRRH